MKNNGFFSIYALMWLNIVTIAAVLIIASAVSLKNAKTDMPLYDAQIVAVYRVKERLIQMNQCMMNIELDDSEEGYESELSRRRENLSKEQRKGKKTRINVDKDREETDEENDAEIDDGSDRQEQEANCISKSEAFSYQDIHISIDYDTESCTIRLNDKLIHLNYTISDESIDDLVYSSVK